MSGTAVDLALGDQSLAPPAATSRPMRRRDPLLELEHRVECSSDDGGPLTSLSPGQRFQLRVLIKTAAAATTEGWTRWSGPLGDLELSLYDHAGLLQFDETDNSGVVFAEQGFPIPITAQELSGLDPRSMLSFWFRVTAPTSFAGATETAMVLKLREALPQGYYRDYPQPTLALFDTEGISPHPHPPEKPAVAVDLAVNPLPDAAWLRIRRQSRDGLSIRGDGRGGTMSLPRVTYPDIDLAQIIQDRHPPSELFGRLREYSRTALGKLGAWLKEMRGAALDHPEDLCLVVDDRTDAQIPWELVETCENCFLGTQATVVRWLETPIWEGEYLSLATGATVVEGDVAHYLDGALVNRSTEQQALCNCCAREAQSLSALYRMCAEELSQVAFIYLSSHGIFHDQRRPRDRYVKLWTESHGDAVFGIDWVMLPIARGDDRRRLPLVFVNACHSGRLAWHEDEAGGFGMPELILTRIARAYVGTLGDVNTEDAERIGAMVIQAARDDPDGLPVAAFLSRIRREAATGFDALTADPLAWRRLLSSFMYVYYGDPRIRLRLRPA